MVAGITTATTPAVAATTTTVPVLSLVPRGTPTVTTAPAVAATTTTAITTADMAVTEAVTTGAGNSMTTFKLNKPTVKRGPNQMPSPEKKEAQKKIGEGY